jgi:thymidylate kinase
MKVIEFIGLPGCGKTTTLKALRDELNVCKSVLLGREEFKTASNQYILGSNKLYAMYLALKSVVFSPSKFNFLYRLSYNSEQDIISKLSMITCSLLTVSQYTIADKKLDKQAKIVVDQGILQSLCSLLLPLKHDAPLDFTSVLKYLSLNEIGGVVFFNCSIQCSKQRINNRENGNSRFDKNSKYQFGLKELHQMQFLLNELKLSLKNNGFSVLELHAHNAPAYNASLIMSWLISKSSHNNIKRYKIDL